MCWIRVLFSPGTVDNKCFADDKYFNKGVTMQKFRLPAMLLLLSFMAFSAWATVSEYSFASTLGTFTEISGGTILGTAANDNESFNAIPLGFTFTYNGVDYTDVSIQSNGFLAMGLEVVTSNQAISNAATSNNVAAALSRDIKSRDTGELMYLLSGTAPHRVFTVQWKHYRRAPTSTANDDFTFQIQLQEEGNKVCFVYGAFTTVNATTAAAIQVGLRGDSNLDFCNRTTSTDWSATTAGTANNNFCTLSATVFPANGLTFTFSPPATGEPPTAAQNPIPTNNATDVSIYTNLSWSAGSGTTDGYKVFLGTDNPPTNIVNGTTQTALSFDPPDFTYNTIYFWKIVPFNANGDALNCPVWSFTTLADPTVSTFPWNENFDTLTPPTLPPGWLTINANSDANTWESYAGTYQSQPNCMRIHSNENLAMNDWLVLPPMQLTQNTNYKIRFYYRASSTTLPEKLALYWGTAPTLDGLTTEIFSNDSINVTTYVPAEAIVTPSTSGVYYFAFKGFSDPDMFFLYLDTISISVWVEALNPPRNLSATIDAHDVHLAWDAPIVTRALLGYNVYRNATLIANIPHPDTLAYHDLALPSGLYSYTVTALYTSGESIPAGPVLADVDPVILPPINLAAQVVERDVTLTWNNPEGDWITWTNMTTGNAVGTNSAIVFDVAHRWTHEDLIPYLGRSLTRIEFIPIYNDCVYTLKVWTGGSATSAGTLVHSQEVVAPVLNEWNTVFLTSQIPIPATGEMYYGIECNTQGGYPAAADAGPAIEGKGNMMYFQGAWQTLTQLAPEFNYNWSIRAFAQYGTPTDAVALTPITTSRELPYATGTLSCQSFSLHEPERNITGYKVYRDGTLLATLNSEEENTYTDQGRPNATYLYGVVSVSPNGDSEPATIEVVVNMQLAEQIFGDDFEAHPDFAETFGLWYTRDIDNAPTAGIPGISFPGSGEPTSYMVFNPAATTPPLTSVSAHDGSKMLAAFAANGMVNNDWIISPSVHLGTNSRIKFFARSLNNTNGLERFRLGVSNLPIIVIQSFQYVTGPDYVEAPLEWTEYVYDISNWDDQNVYVCIRCVSDSASVFMLDDITIHSDGGYVANDDPVAPELTNALFGNYPNPFNPETTIRYSTAEKTPVTIDVYNLKGQLVRHLVNENKDAGSYTAVFDGRDNHGLPLASGVYFYKMNAGNYNATRKMILMK